jgi:hypothetical protein
MPTTAAPRPQALDRRGAMRSFDPDGARADLSEAIAQFRATGSYTSLTARLDSRGVLELENGDLEAAQVYLHESVAIADALALPRFRWGVHTNLGYWRSCAQTPAEHFSLARSIHDLRRGSGTAR